MQLIATMALEFVFLVCIVHLEIEQEVADLQEILYIFFVNTAKSFVVLTVLRRLRKTN